jgi:hypothetical protein
MAHHWRQQRRHIRPCHAALPPIISNTGKTPALDVTADIYVEIVPNGYEPHFGGGIPHNRFDIGAITPNNPQNFIVSRYRSTGRVGEVADDPVSLDEKTRLTEGRAWLAVHGKVRYRDVFKHWHWATYCSWNKFNPAAEYAARSCSAYNGIDED